MRCKHDYVYARGMMHCRKCNKQIEPRIGRQRRRRVNKTVAIALLAVVAVGAFFGLQYMGVIPVPTGQIIQDFSTYDPETAVIGQVTKEKPHLVVDDTQGKSGEGAERGQAAKTEQPDQTITQAVPSDPLPKADMLQESRILMLGLINEERDRHGLSQVSMGSNDAAQAHADDLLAGCTAGHWGTDGLKPYMRYSLAGGYQHNAENVSGLSYCVGFGYVSEGPSEGVREAMDGLMTSPGHRDNILDPRHAFVNIGVANDGYNTMVVQHFEYDYIDFESLPEIDGGVASFEAIVAPSLNFDDYDVTLYYDPPPHSLEPGQLSRTYCYDLGEPIVSIRPALSDGWEYTEDTWNSRLSDCPNPYDVPASRSAPSSPQEAELHHEEAKRQSNTAGQGLYISKVVPWYTTNDWKISGDRFEMKVKIADILQHYGPGVYTFNMGGFIGDDYISLSEYSVFHDIEIPGDVSVG